MLMLVARADAVIIYGREARNLAPPPAPYRAAWDLQGRYMNFNGTPISPTHFVTALHIGGGGGFTFAGQTYAAPTAVVIPGTDLVIRTIDTEGGTRQFPTYAPLWDPAVDGSEVGKPLVAFGRGTARGAAITAPLPQGPPAAPVPPASTLTLTGTDGSNGGNPVSSTPAGPTPPRPAGLRGWAWGVQDFQQSWGTNAVDAIVPDDAYGDLLSFDFDANAADRNEAALSSGDSSGGVFIFSNGQWKLAGVNLGVDGAWSTTEPGPYAQASIFDARGLYVGNAASHQFVPYANAEVPGSSYSTRIAAHLDAIRAATGGTAGGSTGGTLIVPEPTAIAGLASVLLLATRRRLP